MPELLDFPVEILRMIAERCDFRPRFNLRSTTKSMKEVVDQSKFFLHFVTLEIWNPRSLKMSFEYRNRHGNMTRHKIEMGIETADSMEKTAKWMANIFKNAEIRRFIISGVYSEDRSLNKNFLQKVKENLKSPLKARYINCISEIDPLSICDKSYIQRLTCHYGDPNFFHTYLDTFMNLDEVLLRKTMNITDQDVLSMKATNISLKSEDFSAEMVNELLDKFIAKNIIESEFCIYNPKGNFIPDIKIPDGFIASTKFEGRHKKINGNKRMYLIVAKESVWFQILRMRNSNN